MSGGYPLTGLSGSVSPTSSMSAPRSPGHSGQSTHSKLQSALTRISSLESSLSTLQVQNTSLQHSLSLEIHHARETGQKLTNLQEENRQLKEKLTAVELSSQKALEQQRHHLKEEFEIDKSKSLESHEHYLKSQWEKDLATRLTAMQEEFDLSTGNYKRRITVLECELNELIRERDLEREKWKKERSEFEQFGFIKDQGDFLARIAYTRGLTVKSYRILLKLMVFKYYRLIYRLRKMGRIYLGSAKILKQIFQGTGTANSKVSQHEQHQQHPPVALSSESELDSIFAQPEIDAWIRLTEAILPPERGAKKSKSTAANNAASINQFTMNYSSSPAPASAYADSWVKTVGDAMNAKDKKTKEEKTKEKEIESKQEHNTGNQSEHQNSDGNETNGVDNASSSSSSSSSAPVAASSTVSSLLSSVSSSLFPPLPTSTSVLLSQLADFPHLFLISIHMLLTQFHQAQLSQNEFFSRINELNGHNAAQSQLLKSWKLYILQLERERMEWMQVREKERERERDRGGYGYGHGHAHHHSHSHSHHAPRTGRFGSSSAKASSNTGKTIDYQAIAQSVHQYPMETVATLAIMTQQQSEKEKPIEDGTVIAAAQPQQENGNAERPADNSVVVHRDSEKLKEKERKKSTSALKVIPPPNDDHDISTVSGDVNESDEDLHVPIEFDEKSLVPREKDKDRQTVIVISSPHSPYERRVIQTDRELLTQPPQPAQSPARISFLPPPFEPHAPTQTIALASTYPQPTAPAPVQAPSSPSAASSPRPLSRTFSPFIHPYVSPANPAAPQLPNPSTQFEYDTEKYARLLHSYSHLRDRFHRVEAKKNELETRHLMERVFHMKNYSYSLPSPTRTIKGNGNSNGAVNGSGGVAIASGAWAGPLSPRSPKSPQSPRSPRSIASPRPQTQPIPMQSLQSIPVSIATATTAFAPASPGRPVTTHSNRGTTPARFTPKSPASASRPKTSGNSLNSTEKRDFSATSHREMSARAEMEETQRAGGSGGWWQNGLGMTSRADNMPLSDSPYAQRVQPRENTTAGTPSPPMQTRPIPRPSNASRSSPVPPPSTYISTSQPAISQTALVSGRPSPRRPLASANDSRYSINPFDASDF